jgi:Tol biopolymer transport system component
LLAPSATPGDVPVASNVSRLTAAPGIEWFPALSPDGRWVVYAADEAGNRDIYLQSASGETPINLTRDSLDDDDQPAFSPDGERIAFRSNRDGGGLFIMGRTGEAARRVTRSGFNPAWSPDGKRLAYATESVDVSPLSYTRLSELWLVPADGGEARRLTDRDAVQPAWSPNGRWIAYMTRLDRPAQFDIQIVSEDGGRTWPVTAGAATDWNPIWAPDGRHLYFASDRGGAMNLWRIAIDAGSGNPLGEPQPITTPTAYIAHLSISADGRRLAYSSVLQTANIQRLRLDAAAGAVQEETHWLTTGSRSWSSPDPSPDGGLVTFYSRLQPEGHLYVIRSDGTGLRQLTGDAAIDRVPRWSPDGRWILFFSNRSGALELWKIQSDGSDLRQLTEGGIGGYPLWSPDGLRTATTALVQTGTATSAVLFDPNRPWGEQTPERLPMLTHPSSVYLANSWSPDGERLVGTAGLTPPLGIVTYDLRSRMYRQLTNFGEWPVWFPDGRRVLFVADGKNFFTVDAETRATRKVFSVDRDVIGPPRLTRDGRTAFFSRRVTEADVWLITLD